MVATRHFFLPLSLITATVVMTACERLPSIYTGSDYDADIKPPLIIDAHLPTATTTIDCVALVPNQTVIVKGHSVISQGCDLTEKSIRFELNTSDSSLDCQGAVLSPTANDASKASAITIKPKTDSAINNIAVANCHIDGYGHALHIRQYSNPNQRYARGLIAPAANRA
ncbi:MAG: hypothetical protein ABS880_09750, partial [Psychrobacter alimentarius]